MRDIKFFMILLLIPALAALAHDLFLFIAEHGVLDIVENIKTEIELKGPFSQFAALGFIWTQYHPESYKWVVQNTNQDVWNIINMILTQKAVFVGLGFAGFFYFILLILRILGVWPFSTSQGRMRKTKTFAKKDTKFHYSRK